MPRARKPIRRVKNIRAIGGTGSITVTPIHPDVLKICISVHRIHFDPYLSYLICFVPPLNLIIQLYGNRTVTETDVLTTVPGLVKIKITRVQPDQQRKVINIPTDVGTRGISIQSDYRGKYPICKIAGKRAHCKQHDNSQ
jgi:hypothetical protein